MSAMWSASIHTEGAASFFKEQLSSSSQQVGYMIQEEYSSPARHLAASARYMSRQATSYYTRHVLYLSIVCHVLLAGPVRSCRFGVTIY